MAFITPATVSPGDKYNASAHNIVVGDLIDLDTRVTNAAAYVVPTGSITAFVGTVAPSGWLLCNGSQVSQTTYSALYTAIGANKFGTDTGGNFFLPDLRGRVPVGLGTNTDVDVIGDNDGAALANRRVKHLHTVGNAGQKDMPGIANNTNFAAGSGVAAATLPWTSQAGGLPGYNQTVTTADAHAHTVGPQTTAPTDGPSFLTLNFIIKY